MVEVRDDPDAGPEDPLRQRLLDAATRVFARRGYEGTRILDIVREAELSTGAVYSRFGSKDNLLREAVVGGTTRAVAHADGAHRVADLLLRASARFDRPLSDADAVRLEAMVAARREDDVAAAVAESHERWLASVAPLVEAAIADGTIDDGVDPDAVLFLVSVVSLGMLLRRASRLPGPDPDAWASLMARVVGSFGRTDAEGRGGSQ